MFFRVALLILKKDFTIELKSREIVYTTLLFALSAILIFSLTFVVEGQPLAEAAAGIVWIAIAFSGTLALGRSARAQTPKPGGSIISAQNNEATGLDPQLVPAFSRSRRSPLTYSQLVRFDENMTIQPELAESWTLSDDKLTWTFKLRQGVKFHDGQELTSNDVKFTFDRLLDKSAGGKADFTAVDKVEPAGKYQVKFVTKEPFAALMAALAGFWGYIVSEAGVNFDVRPPKSPDPFASIRTQSPSSRSTPVSDSGFVCAAAGTAPATNQLQMTVAAARAMGLLGW